MDKLINIGYLCKELVTDWISPNRNVHMENLLDDITIDTQFERHSKCIAIATGNIFTNILILNIDIIKQITYYLKDNIQKYSSSTSGDDSSDYSSDYSSDGSSDDESIQSWIDSDMNDEENDNTNDETNIENTYKDLSISIPSIE